MVITSGRRELHSIDSLRHDRVQGPGDIQTGFSRHSSLFLYFAIPVK
jgi:hypothetical protein